MHPSDPDLAERTWEAVPHELVFVPLGSVEQHGPHLPLATDTVIATAVARDLVDRARRGGIDAALAPAVSYGASGEHEGFAGTVSIGTDALTGVLLELGRSASRWARRLVFVNGHGGNVEAVAAAVARLRAEGRDIAWVPCEARPAQGASDAHAGRIETSLMLHLAPDDVRIERAEAGETRPLELILPALRAGGVAAVSPNGVLGDPSGASADEGAALLADMGERAWARVRDGATG